jgi:hypothetical protein
MNVALKLHQNKIDKVYIWFLKQIRIYTEMRESMKNILLLDHILYHMIIP